VQSSDALISGVGDISVAGQADDQKIILLTFDAPEDHNAENLSSATFNVEIAGSESAAVGVSTTPNAHITGSG
jgi:hypothetical protein